MMAVRISSSGVEQPDAIPLTAVTSQVLPIELDGKQIALVNMIKPSIPALHCKDYRVTRQFQIILLLLSAFTIRGRHSGFSFSSFSYQLYPPPSLQPQPCPLSPHP